MSVVISTPACARAAEERVEEATFHLTSNQEFLAAVLGRPRRFHYASRDKLCVAGHPALGYLQHVGYEAAPVSLGIQAIHRAFAAHVPLSLTPDLLWYMIVHEVAEYVRQNPGRHAAVFTSTPESKQKIVVRDDSLRRDEPSDWQRSINLVRDPLRAMISDYTMELFLPRFSTTTVEAQTALLIALMDVVSPFYDFGWVTRCGIPQIRLEGEAADWQSLHFRSDQLAREFGGMSGYFADLLPVLQTIAETAAGMTPDDEFWRSIYKYHDSSGGPYVTGWITAFFAYLQTWDGPRFKDQFNWRGLMSRSGGGYGTSKFPSHVSAVPFVWDYFGTLYNMTFAAGVTGVDFDDDTFLAPRLGYAVVEA